MGTVKPAVFRKQVIRVQVQVWCCKLPTHMITIPVPVMSQVFTVFFVLVTGQNFIIILLYFIYYIT